MSCSLCWLCWLVEPKKDVKAKKGKKKEEEVVEGPPEPLEVYFKFTLHRWRSTYEANLAEQDTVENSEALPVA